MKTHRGCIALVSLGKYFAHESGKEGWSTNMYWEVHRDSYPTPSPPQPCQHFQGPGVEGRTRRTNTGHQEVHVLGVLPSDPSALRNYTTQTLDVNRDAPVRHRLPVHETKVTLGHLVVLDKQLSVH